MNIQAVLYGDFHKSYVAPPEQGQPKVMFARAECRMGERPRAPMCRLSPLPPVEEPPTKGGSATGGDERAESPEATRWGEVRGIVQRHSGASHRAIDGSGLRDRVQASCPVASMPRCLAAFSIAYCLLPIA